MKCITKCIVPDTFGLVDSDLFWGPHEFFCFTYIVVLIMLSVFIHNSWFLKVLVPLVLLQQFLMELTRRGQEPLSALVNFGVTYLEDYSADYIIQQGGWVRRQCLIFILCSKPFSKCDTILNRSES